MLVATQPQLGCKATSSAGTGAATAPTLPAGAVNQFDATAFRTLADSHAAIASVQQNVASGTLTITAAQKTTLNQIITDQNTAQALYKAYHAVPTGDTTALSAAIAKLVPDIAAITTMLEGK
jgi:hypothetical protein